MDYLNSDSQSCPLLEFGAQLIPRAVRKFIGILTQLTIISRDRKAFFSFSDFSSCRLFDVNNKILSVSFHVSLEKKTRQTGKGLFQVSCFTYNGLQITFISAMLFVGSIYLRKEEIFQKTIMYDTSMAIAVLSEVKSPLRFANFFLVVVLFLL